MSCQLLLLLSIVFLCKSARAHRSCLDETNALNYLFLNTPTRLRVPLLPPHCVRCHAADQVDIQLVDEQFTGNRTIQRVKILLRNFEIEDASYICLVKICPISVEHGSDSIFVNVTLPLFAHVFLALLYRNDDVRSTPCTLQTRFALVAWPTALACTETVYLHPRRTSQVSGRLIVHDCRAETFEQSVYRARVHFQHSGCSTTNPIIAMQSSGRACEYIVESVSDLSNTSLMPTQLLTTTVTISSSSHPWKDDDTPVWSPCQTQVVPYQEIFYTDEVTHTRSIHVEQGQTIELRCPIGGSEQYLKYAWYYQRYQPKYQLSHNRTVVLNNITEQMQGRYMCTGDDGNEVLEFETTIHVLSRRSSTFHPSRLTLIIILALPLIAFCLILSALRYFASYESPPTKPPVEKRNSLTIHHDVVLTVQHTTGQQTTDSLWNHVSYQTFDYIDEQAADPVPWSWIETLDSLDPRHEHIAHRLSARHRNVNGQPPGPLAIPMLSTSDVTLSHQHSAAPIEQISEMPIVKISVPRLNQYPPVRRTDSMASFDSQTELEHFNRMTSVCVDMEATLLNCHIGD